MKIACIGDTHLGIRNGSEIIQEHQNRFFNEIFFPYLIAHDIKHIIHLGDYFDNRKFLSIKCLHSNRKAFLERLRDLGIHMDIILGNHDTVYKNTNEVNSLKEVFGFFVNNIDIITEPRVLHYGGIKIGALPWIAPDNIIESDRFLKTADIDVLVAHLELSGFEMMKGQPVQSHGMDPSILQRIPMVLSGHYHTKSTKDNIHYLGTPFELTWADCHDPKYFHVLDTETAELLPVRNPLTIHKKIYYNDSLGLPDLDRLEDLDLIGCFVKLFVLSKKDFFHFDRYVEKIQMLSPYELKIVESYDDIRTGDNPDEVEEPIENTQEMLSQYVDRLETDLDKEKLKSRLVALHLEAQSLDIAC